MTDENEALRIEDLRNGDRVRLYPSADNPIHKCPVEATFSDGYFFCDGSDPRDGPDYYVRDVLLYNERIEAIQ